MPDDRRDRLLRRLDPGDGTAVTTARLCTAFAEITDMSGAGIMLMAADLWKGSVCASNDVSGLIEDLQFTLGEGPCVDAYEQSRPTIEPDLVDPAGRRWMAFGPPAVAAGVRAMFAFPVGIGGVRLGAFHVYRDRPGALSDEQHLDALVLAAIAAQSIIDMQAGALPDTLGAELKIGVNFHVAVHQATGMVAVQLGVPIAEALVRLRARAFADGRLVDDVAADVVARRVRFTDDPSESHDG